MIKTVIVLGSKGMLGQTALRFFRTTGYAVVPFEKRFTVSSYASILEDLRQHPEALIINGIASIPQKKPTVAELMWTNATIPLILAAGLLPDQVLVQPSSEGVYGGISGAPYDTETLPQPLDDYGWSKRLGEVAVLGRPRTLVLRVSIIGLDDAPQPKGLLGWFLSQPAGSQLKGFTNHRWNGITTWEWCRQLEKLLERPPEGFGSAGQLLQLGTAEDHTKHELLRLFQDVFDTNHQIAPHQTPQAVDRRLVPDIVSAPLREQLQTLRAHLG